MSNSYPLLQIRLAVLMILPFLTIACNDKSDPEPLPIDVDFTVIDDMDRMYLTYEINEELTGDVQVKWESGTYIDIIGPEADGRYYFMIPDEETDKDVDVTLGVKAEGRSGAKTRSVAVPGMYFHRRYGLGSLLTREVANNVSHDWYVDQGSTGNYSLINCGPASTEMVIKWTEATATVSTEQLRNLSQSSDWWSTIQIYDYLDTYEVNRKYINFTQLSQLTSELDAGNVAILCLDIYYVRTSGDDPQWRKDKYYQTPSTGSGHFIVVKGYKVVDGKYLLEVYDPWSIGAKYTDGQFKGLDRYYRSEDILRAVSVWWKYAIVAGKRATRMSGDGVSFMENGLDPDSVPVQWGGRK